MNRLVGLSQADEKVLYKRVTGFPPILVFSSTGGIDIMAVDAGLLKGEKQLLVSLVSMRDQWNRPGQLGMTGKNGYISQITLFKSGLVFLCPPSLTLQLGL